MEERTRKEQIRRTPRADARGTCGVALCIVAVICSLLTDRAFAAQNIEFVEISSGYRLLDGTPVSIPYVYNVMVVGTGIERAQVITPNGNTLELTEDIPEEFYVGLYRSSYSELCDDPALGFGTFTIRVQDENEVWDERDLPYDPGCLTPPVTGHYEPVFPTHGQADVPLIPVFQWTCSNDDCGTESWLMVLGFLGGDDPELYFVFLNSTDSSWAPGELLAGLWYWFEPRSIEPVSGGSQSLETVGGDSFFYWPVYYTRNTLEFATSADPWLTVVRDIPFDRILWTPEPGLAYDLIRGDLSSLTLADGHVDTGTVICLAEQDISGSVEDDDPSGDPPVGSSWFYLLRDDTTPGSYGYSNEFVLDCEGSDCPRPRIPSGNDCVAGSS